ncbi:hypothetical protein BCAH1134_C0641 (plasmid) [Bacillus cereus AH1134]|nr:hypothetical protein BCAH1134_C0641 [Bacillus cereus AH1134]
MPFLIYYKETVRIKFILYRVFVFLIRHVYLINHNFLCNIA